MNILELNDWQALLLAFAGSMFITWYSLPKIVKIARFRKLTDKPGVHKIHGKEIPALGGVAIFAGFTFGLLLTGNMFMDSMPFVIASVILLFLIGLKDDLVTTTPWKKIVVQVTVALILILFTDLRFTNLHGFLRISTIPAWFSIPLTIFLIVIIINSFNIIDGIDGLAASVGIIASTTFGTWFWLSNDKGFAIASAALAGSLIVFLRFNLSGGKLKVFMGDSGSLVIGFLLTIMAIRFNEINAGPSPFIKLNSSPSISIAILVVPLFDSLRVITIRLIHGQHPMKADNRHIHHLLLRAGYTHAQSTILIVLANIFIIAVSFILRDLGIFRLGFVILVLSILFTVPVYLLVARKEKWKITGLRIWKLATADYDELKEYRKLIEEIEEQEVKVGVASQHLSSVTKTGKVIPASLLGLRDEMKN